MVLSFGSGGGKKRKKTKNNNFTKRELLFCEDGQQYAIVTSLLGHKRCMVKIFDGPNNEMIGVIRGNMKKSTQCVTKDCIVLVSLRDFQENKCDVIHVYNDSEVKQLVQYEELSNKFVTQNDIFEKNDEIENDIVFEDI